MVFGAVATWKTISDHCGYVFPWDPLRWVNGNGAGFHDLHHQSWGLKVCFLFFVPFLGGGGGGREEIVGRFSLKSKNTD